MLGRRPHVIWRVLWCFVCPALMLAAIIFSMYSISVPVYGTYTYPQWAIILGWLIAIVSLVPVPVVAINVLYNSKGSFLEVCLPTTLVMKLVENTK